MSWEWLEDMEDINLEVKAARKADIDGITQQIDMAKTSIQSATNRDQINNAKNNSKFVIDNAGKYKSTKMYADTYSNYADNKLNDYNMYETALMKADNYLSQNEFLDREKEWLDINNLSKNRGYDSMMDFLKDEMDVVTGYLMDTTDGEGKLKNYNWNKGNKGNDKFIVSKLLKYQNQLSMAMNAAVLDGFISPEEALYAYQADKTDWDTFKKTQVGEAENLIKNGRNKMFRIDELINKAEGSGGFANALNMMTFDEMDGMNINYTTDANGQLSGSTETAETFKQKLNTYKNIYLSDYENGLRKYQSYMGIGYGKMMGEPPDSPDLGDYANVDNYTPLSEELSNQTAQADMLDADNDGIPDTIDIDAGEGTDETVIPPDPEKSFYEIDEIDGHKLSDVRQRKYSVIPSKNYSRTDMSNVKNVENRLKEKREILDGKDKASVAMNKYLSGELNQNQALSEGAYGGKASQTYIVGQRNRKKIDAFKKKFKNSGLSLDEFITQNQKEYFKLTRILKYGKYFKKVNKNIANEHYTNLYK